MRAALWIGVALVFMSAAASAWFAFQRPDFVAALAMAAGGALVKAAGRRKSPEAEAEASDHATERRGGNTAPTAHGHGGENR